MRRLQWIMVATLVVALGALAASTGYGITLHQRIGDLEDAQAEAAASESNSDVGSLIVVGKNFQTFGSNGLQLCVRYRAFDSVDETCILGAAGASAHLGVCYSAAIIGEPLPDVCMAAVDTGTGDS